MAKKEELELVFRQSTYAVYNGQKQRTEVTVNQKFISYTSFLILQLVEVVVQSWNGFLQSLAETDTLDDFTNFGCWVQSVTGAWLPVIKHALWEGLTSSIRPQVSGET